MYGIPYLVTSGQIDIIGWRGRPDGLGGIEERGEFKEVFVKLFKFIFELIMFSPFGS